MKGEALQTVNIDGSGKEAIKKALTDLADSSAEREAFYVLDLGTLYRSHKQWTTCLPRVEPFYAVKCNSNPVILDAFVSLGIGFDCASKGEIEMMLERGVKPQDIIFANPCKSIAHLQYAMSNGVALTTFDNEDELIKCHQYTPNIGLVLRILVDDSYSVCKFGGKFGASRAQASALLKKARELGLSVVGVSFHVGSGCMNARSFYDAVSTARQVFDEATALGHTMTLLDVGGGFPGTDDCAVPFTEIAKVLSEGIDVFFPPSCGVRIIAEPGRYYAASTSTLCVNVFAKRVVMSPQTEGETGAIENIMYYINDGVYGSFNCTIFDHLTPSPHVLKSPRGSATKCSFWGPTCDSMDCIVKDIQMPQVDVGDWLYYEDMGAYTMASSTTFNGFPRPSIYYTFTVDSTTNVSEVPQDFPLRPIESS